MYDVQLIDIVVLRSAVKTRHNTQFQGGKTEWPREVNQAFIPDKLGLPVKVESFGIDWRPWASSGMDTGRTSRRLLLRRLIASYTQSIFASSLEDPDLTSYCFVLPTSACKV